MPNKIEDLDKKIREGASGDTEERTVAFARALISHAKQSAGANISRRMENQDWYEGGKKHWKDQRRPKYRASITDNRIFSVIQSTLPIVTDNRPKADLAARYPEDVDTVDLLKKVYDS